MPTLRPLMFVLLPWFAGCQMLNTFTEQPATIQTRVQGEVSQRADHLLLKPCRGKTSYLLVGEQSEALDEQAKVLFADNGKSLFADLRGVAEPGDSGATEEQLVVGEVYRLQSEGPDCSDPNFKKLLVRANGHEPSWNININSKGMVLERMGQPALPLPYLEEQLPDGSSSISTAADGLKLELWLIPKQCTDSMTGSIQHLTAELNLNGEVLRGCASYGAMRGE